MIRLGRAAVSQTITLNTIAPNTMQERFRFSGFKAIDFPPACTAATLDDETRRSNVIILFLQSTDKRNYLERL